MWCLFETVGCKICCDNRPLQPCIVLLSLTLCCGKNEEQLSVVRLEALAQLVNIHAQAYEEDSDKVTARPVRLYLPLWKLTVTPPIMSLTGR